MQFFYKDGVIFLYIKLQIAYYIVSVVFQILNN